MADSECSVPGCERARKYRLHCNLHYLRIRKTGSVRAETPAREVTRYAKQASCTVEGCASRPKARGWCAFHYQRWQHHGDPLVSTIIYGDDEARFWAKVNKDGPPPMSRPGLGPCWIWQASLDAGGYGWFRADGRMQKAHRWAFSRFVRPVPPELEVDHLCAVRNCVNFEAHLEDVPPLINTRRIVGGNASKYHCKQGHAFSPENTYRRPDGGRGCRICTAAAQRAYKKRKAADG